MQNEKNRKAKPPKNPEPALIPSEEIPVVGIGYSAGGLQVIQELLDHLNGDTGMAFVVIQHLKEGQESRLAEILSRHTRMPVMEIRNGMPVRPNSVYILPPDFDVVLSGGFLNLNPRSHSGAFHLPIDSFFSSLAQGRKSKAIGVVLSGAGSDGTLGLKAIKSEGGVTIVQDPKTARFDGMPRSAIAAAIADLVLPTADISKELARIAKHPYTRATLAETPGEASELGRLAGDNPALEEVLEILKFRTQVNFSKYKASTIRRRIERQMLLRRIETIEKYADYLKKNPDEVNVLYENIFIHVTEFFRDPEAFKSVQENVFPSIVKEKPKNTPIRIWVPGCATGEEVYSIAMTFSEYLETNSSQNPIQIFGTDISDPAIQCARKGIYPEHQMRKLSHERLEKFFDRTKDGYKIKKFVRDACIFSRHDVTSNPPIPKVDLISCRNVLIYFSTDLQKRVFPVFHYALNQGGFLWLGRAENPGIYSKLFAPFDKANKIYLKSKGNPGMPARFTASAFSTSDALLNPAGAFASPADTVRSADQVILFRYSPSGVVVNSDLDVLQFRGRTAPYIEPSPGLATYNLLKLANPELVAALRLCIQTAKKENEQARKENIVFQFEGKQRRVNLDVSPLNPSAPQKERQYLVIFEESSILKHSKDKAKPSAPARLSKKDRANQLDTLAQYNTQLHQELDTSREYQQSLIEEYETSQEELTSSNEELRSTNEELLGTNDELQKRNLELETALKDLEKSEQRFRLMVEAVKDYAIFMLDPDGHIVSWNLGAKRLKGYDAQEIIGSHFSRFYTAEDIARNHPQEELELAARNGVYSEEGWRVRKDGTRFWANVVITAINNQGSLIGFAKVTRDLTERKKAEEELLKYREELEAKVKERTLELAQANKKLGAAVAARDEFLSLASHELKTPLTSLMMQAQIRERRVLREDREAFTLEKLRTMFENDRRQINRMSHLIDDMLDVSRITARKFELKTELLDFCEIVRDVLTRFSEQFAHGGCEATLDACTKAVGHFDRFRMEQVIVNLFTNALKYGRGQPVHIHVAARDHRVILAVRDQGIGISEEDQERIFREFERADDSGVASGLGLGLYIAKHIVEAHQGLIRVESELNRGSTFIVELPLEKGFVAS